MAATVQSSHLSVNGKPVGQVGYGLLSLSIPWDPVPRPEAIKLMKAALENGANLWNGGVFYGTPESNSLHLVRDYFKQYPEDAEKVVLMIKGCFTMKGGPDGSPEGVRTAVEEAIKVLPPTIKPIDIFSCARVDPKVPIETTISTLATLIKEDKIKGLGLSEVSANTIRHAHAIHPVSAVEIELSLFTPDPLHNGIVKACHELSIPIAAYSPVGRGWLTGALRSLDDLPANDFRRGLPRFQPENIAQNLKLVDAIEAIAKRKGTTTAKVSIGWVCQQGGTIPIPGSKTLSRVVDNCHPVILTEDEMLEIQDALDRIPIVGQRYGGKNEDMLNG